MKTLDIVKPEPRTKLEAWERWLNHMQSQFLTMPMAVGKKIEVMHIEKITCTGHGRKDCERLGEHSWFNHAMDSYHSGNRESNLPTGFKEPE